MDAGLEGLRERLAAAIDTGGTRPVMETLRAAILDCEAKCRRETPNDQDRLVRLGLNRSAIEAALRNWY